MTRYFFDVVSRSSSERDSQGTAFSNSQEAHKWARLLALALEFTSGEQDLVGGRVGVRGSDGCELFSIPIGRRETDRVFAANPRATLRRGIAPAPGNIVGKLWTALRRQLLGVETPELAGGRKGSGL
jgi:hypothetical protein